MVCPMTVGRWRPVGRRRTAGNNASGALAPKRARQSTKREGRRRGRRQAAALARRGSGLMDLLPLLPQALADGLLLGGVYAIVAVGLTMTFGVLRFVNFAHGDFLAVRLDLPLLGAALLCLYAHS